MAAQISSNGRPSLNKLVAISNLLSALPSALPSRLPARKEISFLRDYIGAAFSAGCHALALFDIGVDCFQLVNHISNTFFYFEPVVELCRRCFIALDFRAGL